MSAKRARDEHGTRVPVSSKEAQRQRREMVRTAIVAAFIVGALAWYTIGQHAGLAAAVVTLCLGLALALNFDPNE